MSLEVLIPPANSGRVLAAVAIGEACYTDWHTNAFPLWDAYCRRHGLGLFVAREDLVSKSDHKWKKANWQKLLLGSEIAKSHPGVDQVCVLDTDILISPLAPDVFEQCPPETIGVVSQIKNLPQDRELTLRLIAFNRHTHYTNTYPLDSALFMSPQQIFEFHGLPQFDDYLCTGMFIFSVSHHQELLKSWFHRYQANVDSITGGGEEPHLNFELQQWGKLTWLPYAFQALWIYEVAWKYPFLYQSHWREDHLVRACIQSSLATCHFLHFAGSWHECQMWKVGSFFSEKPDGGLLAAFQDYLRTPVTGRPAGLIKPEKQQCIGSDSASLSGDNRSL